MKCKYYDGFWGDCYNHNCPHCAKECTYENQEDCIYFQSEYEEIDESVSRND